MPPPAPAPYYPGYYGSVYPDLAGGYLQGVAAVTNANAQYQVTIQQARSAQVQADMAKLDLRRRISDEKRYEQMMMPNPEQVRIAEMNASLARSRVNPPSGDIWSAVALNDLLIADQTMQRQGLYGPFVPLNQEVLRHINVTTGTARGSVGALNGGRPLQWPFSLQGPAYQDDRAKVDKLVTQIVDQTRSGSGTDFNALTEAQDAVRRMESSVRAQVADLTPDQYIGSKRFLDQVKEGLKVLEQPNAGNYLNGKWTAKGNSVAEMYDDMARNGLKFAPATVSDQPYYTQLYEALITYDGGLTRLASAAGAPPPAAPPRR
jgi:hypothetical protein